MRQARRGGLGIFDMSDPADPVLANTIGAGQFSLPNPVQATTMAGEDWGVAGDWLYVAAGDAGLYIVQVEK